MISPRMRIVRSITAIKKSPAKALAGAAIFHIALTLAIFGVGRLGVAPQQFDRDGIGEFARDSRVHKSSADLLVNLLKQAQIGSWVNSPDSLHVKIYSLSLLAIGPLVGSNILAAEPVNLLCYLAILTLTFSLAKIIAGVRAAWLSALIVAFWPSLLFHTTQFLRDPVVLPCTLGLMTILVLLLRKNLNWQGAIGLTIGGAASIFIIWHTRPEIWLVLTGVVFACGFLLLIEMVTLRRLLLPNLLAIVLLSVVTVTIPRPSVEPLNQPLRGDSQPSSIWSRIAYARGKFIIQGYTSGSIIDKDVVFTSATDVIKYIPRALEIGYLAPFPTMWFQTGSNVGLVGRLISGIEMALTYLLEILACIFIWKNKKYFSSWLLLLTTLLGMLALGLVVANTGTLYRMRYAFWILLVVMGAGSLVNLEGLLGVRVSPEGKPGGDANESPRYPLNNYSDQDDAIFDVPSVSDRDS